MPRARSPLTTSHILSYRLSPSRTHAPRRQKRTARLASADACRGHLRRSAARRRRRAASISSASSDRARLTPWIAGDGHRAVRLSVTGRGVKDTETGECLTLWMRQAADTQSKIEMPDTLDT